MIKKDEIIPLLLAVCPTFKQRWQEHLAYWGDEERGGYTDIAQFAHFLVDSYAAGMTDCFPATFAVIERLITDGDEEVRGIATIGLLEDVQNIASWRSFGNVVFLPWLGAEAHASWSQIEKMWEGKHSLMDVLRAEAVQREHEDEQ